MIIDITVVGNEAFICLIRRETLRSTAQEGTLSTLFPSLVLTL